MVILEGDVYISQVFRHVGFVGCRFLHLVSHRTVSVFLASYQGITYVEVGLQPLAVSFWQLAISCQLLAALTQTQHHVVQLLLFNIAQQAVEVEVIELQIEVGGHKVGKVEASATPIGLTSKLPPV